MNLLVAGCLTALLISQGGPGAEPQAWGFTVSKPGSNLTGVVAGFATFSECEALRTVLAARHPEWSVARCAPDRSMHFYGRE